jgi:hypothetical protein
MVLLAAVFLLASVGTSRACLNDTGVEKAEQEFRSQYNRPTPPPSAAEYGGLNPWGLGALCIGAGMATGSLIVAVGRKRHGGL